MAFLLFLAGQALTVYGVIVPAEIRDYFGDKAAGANTMTVRLGLIKASVLGLGLLSVGAILCGAGFGLKLASTNLPFLIGFLIVMASGYLFILNKYARLYRLSKHLKKKSEDSTEQNIVQLAAENPKWITIVTQTIVIMSIILLIAKII